RKVICLMLLLTASLSGLSSCSITGPQGPQGEQGVQGQPGKDGENGQTPHIGADGDWWIGNIDTNIPATGDTGATGPQGENGKDGSSLLTGNGEPNSNLGKNEDSYIDLDTWNYYIKTNAVWVLQGNIKADSKDHDGTEGLEFYPINDTECAVAVGRAKFLKEIIIPSTYKNYQVTSIYGYDETDGGFANCLNLEKITLPNSIVSIGHSAFYNCGALKNIVIPDSVTTIGKSAFYDCISLNYVIIGNSVTTIGNSAFYCNRFLTTIYCEASSEPSGWDSFWDSSVRTVYWAGQWEYGTDGNPTPII
ncbi:MAG: leucine-rich repeat protein, partial [bacterium]|nr:leucine-rich repeat protein [bacterium]